MSTYHLIVDDYEKLSEDIEYCVDKISQRSYPILRKHSRPVIDSIFGGNTRPVKMLVTVRTDRTDEVLVPIEGKFYTDCTCSYSAEYLLDDTSILVAKSLVDSMFKCGDDILKVIARSSFYPVGACILNEQVYVYINVIIDHTLKDEEFFVLKDCHFENIVDLQSTSTLEANLIDSLILVKGGKEDV